jgi:hypothetical protein
VEIITVLRVLWGRRVVLAAGFVVAIAAALAMGRSPTPASGVAEVRVVFDTPTSQLVGDEPNGAETLAWRTTFAAMQLATDEARGQLAQDAEVPVGELLVTDLELTAPPVPASLPRAAMKAANLATNTYVLNVHTDDVLPVVSVVAAAPDRRAAARVAQAAVRVLQRGASAVDTEDLQGLRIEQAGPVHAEDVPGTSGRKKMAMVAFAVMILWCVGLLTGPLLRGIARTLRETRPAMQ